MKRLFYSLSLLSLVLVFHSCDKDDYHGFGENEFCISFIPYEDLYDELLAGGFGQTASAENEKFISINFRPNETKEIFLVDKDYDLQEKCSQFFMDKTEEMMPYWKMYDVYVPEYTPRYLRYLYAGTKSGASITADKELFGQPAGTNLGPYFTLSFSPTSPMLATYPDCHVVSAFAPDSTMPTFNECFKEGLLFCEWYEFKSNAVIDENLKEVTLSIRIPTEGCPLYETIFGEGYPESFYETGKVSHEKTMDLVGKVHITFEDYLGSLE